MHPESRGSQAMQEMTRLVNIVGGAGPDTFVENVRLVWREPLRTRRIMGCQRYGALARWRQFLQKRLQDLPSEQATTVAWFQEFSEEEARSEMPAMT